jgi:hypothetical protein
MNAGLASGGAACSSVVLANRGLDGSVASCAERLAARSAKIVATDSGGGGAGSAAMDFLRNSTDFKAAIPITATTTKLANNDKPRAIIHK